MDKFKCKICQGELKLIVRNIEENVYTVNKDGEIEFYDNRDYQQKIKLKCCECGTTCEFQNELLIVENKLTLRVENINSCKSNQINKNNLLIK